MLRKSASFNLGVTKFDTMTELRRLLKCPGYVMLVISFSLLYGTYNCFAAVVSSITYPFGYTPAQNGVFGTIFIVSGVLGTIFFGYIIDKTEKFKLTTISIALLAVASLAASLWVLPMRNPFILSINLAFMGFGMIPVFSTGLVFAVELSYPVPEAISNGMMILSSTVFGTVFVRILVLYAALGFYHLFCRRY